MHGFRLSIFYLPDIKQNGLDTR